MRFSNAFQQCISAMRFSSAFQQCVSAMRFSNAFQQCVSAMPFRNAFQQCLSAVHFSNTFQQCISAMRFSSAFQQCVSVMRFSNAFQQCVSVMRFSNAFHRAPYSIVFHSTESPFACVSHTAVQAIKQKWKEFKQQDAISDTDPLTDVEYDDHPAESDAAGGTPGSSLATAGTSSQKRALESTPTPLKKQKQQVKGARPAVLECVRPSSAGTAVFLIVCVPASCASQHRARPSSAHWLCFFS